MTFEEAIRKSIKSYFRDGGFQELNKLNKGRMKYDKKYFDKFEEEQFGTSTDWEMIRKEV